MLSGYIYFSMDFNEFSIVYLILFSLLRSIFDGKTILQWVHHIYFG